MLVLMYIVLLVLYILDTTHATTPEEEALSLSVILEKGLLYRGMIESFSRVPLQRQVHAISTNFSEYEHMAAIGAEMQLVFPRCVVPGVIFKYAELVAYVLSLELLPHAAIVLDVNSDDALVISLPNLQHRIGSSSDSTSTTTTSRSAAAVISASTSALRRARSSAYTGMVGSRALGIATAAVTCAPLLLLPTSTSNSSYGNSSSSSTSTYKPNMDALNVWLGNVVPAPKHDSHLHVTATTSSSNGDIYTSTSSTTAIAASTMNGLDLVYVNMAILSDATTLTPLQMQQATEAVEVMIYIYTYIYCYLYILLIYVLNNTVILILIFMYIYTYYYYFYYCRSYVRCSRNWPYVSCETSFAVPVMP